MEELLLCPASPEVEKCLQGQSPRALKNSGSSLPPTGAALEEHLCVSIGGKDWAGAHSTTFVSVYHLGKVCFKYQQSWPGTEKCSYFHFFFQGAGGEGTGRGWGCQPLLNNAIIGCHYFLLFFWPQQGSSAESMCLLQGIFYTPGCGALKQRVLMLL